MQGALDGFAAGVFFLNEVPAPVFFLHEVPAFAMATKSLKHFCFRGGSAGHSVKRSVVRKVRPTMRGHPKDGATLGSLSDYDAMVSPCSWLAPLDWLDSTYVRFFVVVRATSTCPLHSPLPRPAPEGAWLAVAQAWRYSWNNLRLALEHASSASEKGAERLEPIVRPRDGVHTSIYTHVDIHIHRMCAMVKSVGVCVLSWEMCYTSDDSACFSQVLTVFVWIRGRFDKSLRCTSRLNNQPLSLGLGGVRFALVYCIVSILLCVYFASTSLFALIDA